ncbi:MAG: hypothetical protein HW421_2939 [Ignavibacteria bacterium]|nr:hypothetical protein [Ignavibacteria bacterium]
MKIYLFIIFCIITIFSFVSCNLFSTRNPEEPNTGGTIVEPPSTPEILISNLIKSFQKKNAENYISCLSYSGRIDNSQFEFIPSAEANSRYSSIFSLWDISSEHRAFISLASCFTVGNSPQVIFSHEVYDRSIPDSIIFVADYYLTAAHGKSNIPTIFSGRVQMTISKNAMGLLRIKRWIDTSKENDTIQNTWSILKAQFNN